METGGGLDDPAKFIAGDEDVDIAFWPSFPGSVKKAVEKHKMILENTQFLQCKAAKPCTCLLMCSPGCEPMAVRPDLYT